MRIVAIGIIAHDENAFNKYIATIYGVIYLDQQSFRYQFVAWRHQSSTCFADDLSKGKE